MEIKSNKRVSRFQPKEMRQVIQYNPGDKQMTSANTLAPEETSVSFTANPTPEVIRKRQVWLIKLFGWYVRRYLRRHFHGVRISRKGYDPSSLDGPVMVVLNHPSWWDPLVCFQLSTFFRNHMHFAPIDDVALSSYRFFERLGFFGIKLHSIQGASKFLQTSLALMQRDDTVLWITAQGEFTDPRSRPVKLMQGVGHLAKRMDRGYILPLALEYPFWQERTPEALACFGTPISLAEEDDFTSTEWTERVSKSLEETQDLLAREACKQEAGHFQTLMGGKTGVGGIFDYWRRFKAFLLGRKFRSDHASVSNTSSERKS